MNSLVRILRDHRASAAMASLVFAMAGVSVWNLLRARADARLDVIRRQGYPVTLTELEAWYRPVPDRENNARTYEQAFASPGFKFDDLDWPLRNRDLSVEDKRRLAEIVAANGNVLRVLHSAQPTNRCRYSIDLKEGFSARLESVFILIRGVQLLCAEAVLHAEEGDSPQSVRSFLDAGLLADSVSEEPRLIAQSCRQVCWSIIVQRMERALAHAPVTDAQLASLQTMVAEAERPTALLRGLAGERPLGIAFFDDSFSDRGYFQGVTERLRIGFAKSAGFFEKDRAFYLDALDKSVAAASLPFPDRLRLGGQVPSRGTAPFSLVSRLILPNLSSGFASEADAVARMRAAQIALAVERFRREHGGALPARLEEVVPGYCKALPTDPFDGGQLGFKVLDSGFFIYTSGADTRNPGPLGFQMIKVLR